MSGQDALFDPAAALVAGVDEAGRGPLAGPVVAAAVVLDDAQPIDGIDDSKRLSATRRDALAGVIERQALACCVALASVEEIDRLNILHATMLAMQRALGGLGFAPDTVLVDGNRAPTLPLAAPDTACVLLNARLAGREQPLDRDWPRQSRVRCIVGGDALDPSIGAASILAKVHRDRLMQVLDTRHPGYGFGRHKGYGTRVHLDALQRLGASPAHRRSFAPVRAVLD